MILHTFWNIREKVKVTDKTQVTEKDSHTATKQMHKYKGNQRFCNYCYSEWKQSFLN